MLKWLARLHGFAARDCVARFDDPVLGELVINRPAPVYRVVMTLIFAAVSGRPRIR